MKHGKFATENHLIFTAGVINALNNWQNMGQKDIEDAKTTKL
jgi:hypothetical protein